MPTTYELLSRLAFVALFAPIHELAHGFVAYKLGDRTAYTAGRLTLNPLAHIDPLGTFLILFTGYGWAKGVPVDQRYFRNPKRDMALTALAGPVANILIALVMLIVYKLTLVIGPQLRYSQTFNIFFRLLLEIIFINIALAAFNLFPIPPLDGSKILGAFLPNRLYYQLLRLQGYASFALVMIITRLPLFGKIFSLLVGGIFSGLDYVTKPLEWLIR